MICYVCGFLELYLYFSGDEISRILERCTLDTYIPSPWLFCGGLQTRVAIGSVTVPFVREYQREILKARNGSTVSIDWFDHPEEMNKKFAGLLLIMNHACNGNMTLVNSAISLCGEYNLGCCLITMPGISDLPLSFSNAGFNLSLLPELEATMERVNQHVGVHFPKVGLGFSLGGIPLLEFSEFAGKSAFFATAYVSLPINIEQFLIDETLVTTHCLRQMQSVVRANSEFLTSVNPAWCAQAMEATSLKEFLQSTCPNPEVLLTNQNRPTLLVFAIDDVAVPFFDSVDLIKLTKNKQIAIVVTENGGHCGFKTVHTHSVIVTTCLEFLANTVRPDF